MTVMVGSIVSLTLVPALMAILGKVLFLSWQPDGRTAQAMSGSNKRHRPTGPGRGAPAWRGSSDPRWCDRAAAGCSATDPFEIRLVLHLRVAAGRPGATGRTRARRIKNPRSHRADRDTRRRITSEQGTLAVYPTRLHTPTSLDKAGEILLGQRFTLLIPLHQLPFGQQITIAVQGSGITVHTQGSNIVVAP